MSGCADVRKSGAAPTTSQARRTESPSVSQDYLYYNYDPPVCAQFDGTQTSDPGKTRCTFIFTRDEGLPLICNWRGLAFCMMQKRPAAIGIHLSYRLYSCPMFKRRVSCFKYGKTQSVIVAAPVLYATSGCFFFFFFF